MVLLGPYLLWLGYKQQSDIAQLRIDGVQGSGTVVEGSEFQRKRGGKSYSLTVSYVASDGRERQKEFIVGQSLFDRHCGTDSIINPDITVEYSKSDPDVARLPGQEDTSSVLLIAGAVVGLIGLAGTAYVGRQFIGR